MTPALLEAAAAIAVLGARVLRARRSADDDEPHEHAEANTYGLPTGQPIEAELVEWLAKQKAAVLAAIPDETLPSHFPDLTAAEWLDPMATRMTPILGAYWDDAGKAVFGRLGLDPNEWRVVNPHLNAEIRKQALAFCRSTNGSTSKTLGTALTMLRQELAKGLVEEGESVRELTKRVKYVFEGLSTSHARTIAATEASRAVHAAELTADVESEVVAGLELLISSDACPLCRRVATECRRVRLGEAFAVIGHHPDYSHIKHPPIHPSCQCTCVEVLKPEYGGPVAPEWGQTLQQPQVGIADWKPPAGKVVPKPEPDRPKPVVVKTSPKGSVSRNEVLGAIKDIKPSAREEELDKRRGEIRREIDRIEREIDQLAAKPRKKQADKERIEELKAKKEELITERTEVRKEAEVLQKARHEARTKALVELIEAHQSDTTITGAFHGMSTPETFRSIEFEGLKFHFADLNGQTGKAEPITITLGHLAETDPLPKSLTKHTHDIYLSAQRNKDDAYWEKKYNTPNFRANATGGDHNVVFYNGYPAEVGTLAHEMGHNLATAKFGSTAPTPGSDYAKAMASAEPPVSKYATNSPDEDFAESVKHFVTERDTMKKSHPLRFHAVQALL